MATGLFNLKQVNQAISQGAWSGYIAPRWVEYLCVAGGGGGRAGGSGGGGLLTGIVTVAAGTSYTVTVGGGGASGANGSDSVFGSIAATGGATGASGGAVANSGGSGGGGYGTSTYTAGAFGVSGQGNAGGAGNTTAGGGGGGAGTVGIAATSTAGGNGGAGIASAISGTVVTYAGGSGGGGSVSGGTGGVGGGGTGAVNAANAGGGNTGGGGGSSYNGPAAAGGSGIVVVRYPGSVQFFTGGTLSYANGYIIHTFYANGTLAPTTPTPYVTDYQISRSLRFNSADSAYLNRTPSASNRKTWTLSAWVKRAVLSSEQQIFSSQPDANNWTEIYYRGTDNLTFRQYVSSAIVFEVVTSALLRDVSAWYHLVVVLDTTQATASSRLKLYINGVDQALTFNSGTYPTQNSDLFVNAANAHYIGQRSSAVYPNHYMTEVNFIDGQALTPSSFGYINPATGVWSPLAFVGTYGTNGFELTFADNSNTTAATLGKDYSGNGNNWTPNNFSVTAGAGNDSLVDSPTSYGTDTGVGGTVRGNYATLNPLLAVNNTAQTYSNGNLQITDNGAGSTSGFGVSTIDMASGKWYIEATVTAIGTGGTFGIWQLPILATTTFSSQTNYRWYSVDGKIYNASGATANSYATWGTSDVLSVAVDMDAGSVTFYKNGTSQGSAITGLTGSWVVGFNAGGSNTIFTANFGQRPFAYTAPSGFKALCTQNLPTPTIGATTATLANKYFDISLWTGNGTSQTLTNSGGFQPDWVWLKSRSSGTNFHNLFDVLRGATKHLFSNSIAAEGTNAQSLTAFTSTGFSVGNDNDVNQSSGTYVGWQWKANGAGVSNTSGSITSTVSANTTSGFSVVTFTGTNANATIGHGLGVAPAMIIMKVRNAADDSWQVYHKSLTSAAYRLQLNSTAAEDSQPTVWNSTAPTSTVFSVGNNVRSLNQVAYCFAEIAGYSAFGKYTGNGSADGPFVFTGFRPAYVLAKKSSGIEIWFVLDSKRGTYNVNKPRLNANNPDAESSAYDIMDFTSNGFKFRNSDTSWNGSGDTYIFAAFAESPFKYSLAR